MQIIVHGTESAARELLANAVERPLVHYVPSAENFLQYPDADAYIDFDFEKNKDNLAQLQNLQGLVMINSVVYPLEETNTSFIRINGWPGFLESEIIEASYISENLRPKAETFFRQLNKAVEWLPDEPGFVTPRIISMIINEAYFALQEEVSTREDIDAAMKLGTAYPYGPFEWAQKIGLRKIMHLLNRLSEEKTQYAPAPLLVQEALATKE